MHPEMSKFIVMGEDDCGDIYNFCLSNNSFRAGVFWNDVNEVERNDSGFYSEWATTEL